MRDINVGLIGFGTVGTGVVKLLAGNSDLIAEKLGARLVLRKIADLDTVTDRGVKLAPGVLTDNVNDILDNPGIDIVIELIGGYEPAKTFVLRAIAAGKHVVTANKALLALHGDEIYGKAAAAGVEVLYEAAVGGGIPILSAIKGNLAANRFTSILGILNGTCNYILTRMTKEGSDFDTVLKAAQALGYAEADPTFDIEGIDTAHKLALLISLCFGTRVPFEQIYTEGVTAITDLDISFAQQFGYRIKLLAIGKRDGDRIEARVHPTMIPVHYPMADVDGPFNAIRLTGDFVGPVMLYGRGAGMDPTASAVVGDAIDISRNLLAGIGCRVAARGTVEAAIRNLAIKPVGEIVSRYYIRFSAVDRPGVLAAIAGALGRNNISIESMIQNGRSGDYVPIVIITHEAAEQNVVNALTEIDRLEMIREQSRLIRIEDNLE